MKRAYKAEEFLQVISKLKEPLTKEQLLHRHLLLDKEKELEIYYAPFDYINQEAKVMIVGITPGWTQMQLSYQTVMQALTQGQSLQSGVQQVKQQASFAGSMRTHLTAMLDELGLPTYLGIPSSSSLFSEHRQLLHPCSMLRYPVFVSQKNYTGHQPTMARSSLLMEWITAVFLPEMQAVKPTVIVPLGKAVSEALLILARKYDAFDEQRCLFGFPHPSGANGHRHKQFQEGKQSFLHRLQTCFSI